MLRPSFAALASLALLAACSTDRTLAPKGTVLTDGRVTADVAVSSGDAIAWDLDRLAGFVSADGASSLVDKSAHVMPWQDSTCSYAALTGKWSCAAKLDNGLTAVRSYTFLDGAGKAMRVYDELLTATVYYYSRWDGKLKRDSTYSVLVHRTRNFRLSGLAGNETTRRWNASGTSADTVVHTGFGSVRTYGGTATDSLQNVIIPYPFASNSWPVSGTSVRTTNFVVTANEKSESRAVVRRTAVVFNGTSSAVMQVGSTTCVLHLDTHIVDGCTG